MVVKWFRANSLEEGQNPSPGRPCGRSEARMNIQFLKDHLLDLEVVIALGVGALLRYGLGTSWLFAIVLGLSAFVLIPLLIRLAFYIRALYFIYDRKS